MRDAVGPGDERVWYPQEIEHAPISFQPRDAKWGCCVGRVRGKLRGETGEANKDQSFGRREASGTREPWLVPSKVGGGMECALFSKIPLMLCRKQV